MLKDLSQEVVASPETLHGLFPQTPILPAPVPVTPTVPAEPAAKPGSGAESLSERERRVAAMRSRLSDRQRAALGKLRATPPAVVSLPRRTESGPAPLSFSQERLWFLDRLDPGNVAYSMPSALRLTGALDVVILERCLGEIVRRHDSLRTTFLEVDNEPRQAAAPPGAWRLPVVDLGGLGNGEREGEARRLSIEEAATPFDLSRGPLVRNRLLLLSGSQAMLLLNKHHIISDGWSFGLLVRETIAFYKAFSEVRAGRPWVHPLRPLPIQYADYAAWQRQRLTGEMLDEQLRYWLREMEGADTVLELPVDRPRPAVRTSRGLIESLRLPPEVAGPVREMARREGATLFMLFLAATQAWLHRYSGQSDILLGTPVANRGRTETEELIGFFVNTLVLRGRIETPDVQRPAFRALLERTKTSALAAFANQDLPFERLIEAMGIERSLSHTPLFQAMLAFQNLAVESLLVPGLTLEPEDVAGTTTHFDFSVAFMESGEEIFGDLEYSSDLFDTGTIRRLIGHFRTFLEAAVREPDRPIAELPLLTEAEQSELWARSNGPLRTVRLNRCLHHGIEEQAALHPEALAVLTPEGDSLTYAQLDRLAGRLAHRLRRAGAGPDVPVGVYLPRSAELVVSMLAVLKSGGAYLPLDPGYPPERLAYILEDSGAPVVITSGVLAERLGATAARVVLVDAPEDLEETRAIGVPAVVQPGNLAYIIYTSGSTGRPKGTGIAHGPACEHMEVAAELFGLGPGERMLQFVSPGFDVTMEEMLPPLLAGAAVVPSGAEVWPPEQFLQRLADLGVTTFDIPTAYWHQWVRESEGLERLPDGLRLRFAAMGGEAMSAEVARLWFRTPLAGIPGIELVNTYGPTEAIVTATALTVDRGLAARTGGSIPLGGALAGRSMWVLDVHDNPAPANVIGELCLGGPMLARGYLGRPELTAESFRPDPFGPPGARLYRTGDLVRWLADGRLEFVGRLDHQVKVRGFRIELGEIEAALARLPGVREAVVLARDFGQGGRRGKGLAGYVVPAAGVDLTAGGLRAALALELPDYMVPSAFAMLEALPLSPNGKVDRRALARVEPESTTDFVLTAPRGPVEEMLAEIWSDLLGVERIGAHQGFFELGGHSLLAMRVASRMRQAFGVDLPLRRLFEAPTVAGLAREVEAALALSSEHRLPPPLRRRPTSADTGKGSLPLSFGQERLWFLDQLEPGSAAYNMPGAVRLTGRLNVPALAAALNGVVRRHEALRTVFTVGPEGGFQEIRPALHIPLPVVDLRGLPPERREPEAGELAEAQGRLPFDLARGPLLRTFLLELGESDHVFALSLHHSVSDGWSVGVLVAELAALYRGGDQALPELPVQYADFAIWQREWLSGEVLETELAWWKERLAGIPALLPLPADRPRPAVQRFRGGSQSDGLPARFEHDIHTLARREGSTVFMVLLAALDSLLARYTGQTDLVVGTPVAGRDSAETEGLIGLFLNTLALRVDASGDPAFRALLARVRDTTLSSFAHSQLPFEKLVEELAPERDLSHAPIFQVLFVLQNTPEERIELPELTLTAVGTDTGTAKFDLVLNVAETGGGPAPMSLVWMFNRDLFDATRIARLRGHFVALLEAAVADPAARLGELPLLSAGERQQLLEWNATGRVWSPIPPTILDLIGGQAARTPDAVAVAFEWESLTYAELWDRAGRLAFDLLGRGVKPDDLVGLRAERSLDLVVGLLGILRAGAAYVPIDPGYPADRIAFMLEDSGVAVLLDEASVYKTSSSFGGRPLERPVPIDPDSLAYMIYTSGSTGRPKGAMNSHRAIRNRLLWMQAEYGLTPEDHVLQKTPFSFDVSVWEFFWPLMIGARLVVALPGGHQDPAYLVETIVREGITTLHFVPSMLRVFLDAPGAERCTGLKRVICSGEALPADLTRRFAEILPGVELHNLYGPTEAAVDVTAWHCRDEPHAVPIGRPIANTAIHIVDPAFRAVPVGVPGELLIGGVQPARGYHRRPELTAEKFIPDESGSRLYRTGDLARWRPDGAIEYLGRIDFQVKIRGIRIELGEIEVALADHPAVRAAVVLAVKDRLIAYVVGEAESDSLRDHLAPRLPEPMIPSAFVFLDEMPLSPNGKVDRNALKTLPEAGALGVSRRERVAPRTPLERFLAGLWSETLGLPVEGLGIHDSFFELGGSSISGAMLINRLQRELGEIVHVVVIFDAPSVSKMAAHLAREHRGAVVRLWGEESLDGNAAEAQDRIGRVDETALAEFRGLIRSLPAARPDGKNPPALFVLSPPRSGSTLLRVMLGGHPGLFSPPELELLSFNTVAERKAAFPGRDSFWLEGVIRAVMEARGCGPEEAKALVNIAEQEAERGGWSTQRFYGWLQSQLDGRLLVDKTPSYALDPAILERAEASFEGARYIHLIRHPYGMIRSFEEAKLDQLFFRQPHRFARRALAELIWLASHRNISEFLAGIPTERQHWVRFEDLVRDPEGEMRRVCAFLGIDYNPDMADPYADPQGGEKTARMTDGIHAEGRMLGDVKFHQHRSVDASAAEQWRALAAEHALGETTWETAVALGYERLASSPGLAPLVALDHQEHQQHQQIPLSFAQERLWFLDQMEPGSPLYNIPVALRLTGALDVSALERSLAEIVRRHAALRTTFGQVAGRPVQIIGEASLRTARVDLSALAEEVRPAQEMELLRLAEDEARRPFDLTRDPLFRATLVRLAPSDHAALATMHHIVSDGWSIGVLVREVGALYGAFSAGSGVDASSPHPLAPSPAGRGGTPALLESGVFALGGGAPSPGVREGGRWERGSGGEDSERRVLESPLPPLPVQDSDYAVWQRRWIDAEAIDRQIAWWGGTLAGAEALELPADRPRPAVRSGVGRTLGFTLTGAVRKRAQALAHTEQASLFMVLLAAFQAVLHRLSGQDDLSVGTPAAGRNRAELEGLIGFFVNTLVVRSDASGAPSFRELLARTRTAALGALAHQDVPFERLVEELAPERDLSRPPLFQVLFALQNAGAGPLELPGLTLTGLAFEAGIAKVDLTLTLSEAGWGSQDRWLEGQLEISRDLFDTPTGLRLAGYFETLLGGALERPDAPLAELPLMSEAQAWQVMGEWPPLPVAFPEQPVHRLFEEQAALRPDATALVGEAGIGDLGISLTYGGLDRRANRLAARLLRLGVRPDDVVAVRIPRSPELVVAELAVLKAGAAFLPIDPAHPEERALFILEDSRPRVLLTTAALSGLPAAGPAVLAVDGDYCLDEKEAGVAVPVTGDHRAYVIFTSGSTGTPKGTDLRHESLSSIIAWHRRAYGCGPETRSALVAGPGFDASAWDVWPYLTSGGSVHVVPADFVASPPDLALWLARERISMAFLTTPVAEAVLAGPPPADLAMSTILTGGERLNRRPAPGASYRLVNHYGPTECTIVITAGDVAPAGVADGPPTIGRPLDNARILLLDRGLRPVPVGVPGELFAAGVCLGRGYHRRPALTAETFLPNPYGRPGDRMYRTGDLARWRADGEIEFVGRIDHQVKIRGIRVELGEIAAVIAGHSRVREAVVLVLGKGDEARLVACLALRSPADGAERIAAEAELRLHLAAFVPSFMIPSGWVFLDALPLTANTKVDRRALERLRPEAEAQDRVRAPLRTPTEQVLATAWSELLGISGIGGSDSFFDLGGHSLMATRLTSRIRELFGVELPLRTVFEEPVLEDLAARIDRELGSGGLESAPGIERRDPTVELPLSFAQERLWFLDRLEETSSARYGIPIALSVRGDLRPDVFRAALDGVVERHESLRTTFKAGPDGSPRQVVAPELRLPLGLVDLSGLADGVREPEAERLVQAEATRGFDLEAGPLLRPLLVRLGAQEHWALLNLHHIVGDGWSVGILIREVAELYASNPHPLAPFHEKATLSQVSGGPRSGPLLVHCGRGHETS